MTPMKKLLVTLGVLIIVVAGYFGYTYYATTYRGITAYAITPNKVPEKTQTYSDSGEKIDGSFTYKYTLEFVKKNGEK